MTNKQPPTKTVHSLSSPYPDPQWPVVESELEKKFLDILIPLLTTVGERRGGNLSTQNRSHHQRKKRKKSKNGALATVSSVDLAASNESGASIASVPSVAEYLTIGFNSTVRFLELMSHRARLQEHLSTQNDTLLPPPIFAVFICTAQLPSVMTAPLPLLVASASSGFRDTSSIRLVPVSKDGAGRMAAALKQPIANVLGVKRGGLGLNRLQDLVQDNVAPIDIPWMRVSAKGQFLPVQIRSDEVMVTKPQKKEDEQKRKVDLPES